MTKDTIMELASMDQNEMKQVVKEALKEWLDEKFVIFGKWSAMGIAAAALALLAYFLAATHGWRPPQ